MTENSDTMTTDHEIMTDTTTDSTDVQERLDRLESLVEAPLDRIETELGIDAPADRQGVANV